MIVSWPDHIKGGRTSAHISAFWDVLPTMAELAGIEPPVCDGLSFLPELIGGEQAKHEFLYWEFHEQGGKQAVRVGNWKGLRLNVHQQGFQSCPLSLYPATKQKLKLNRTPEGKATRLHRLLILKPHFFRFLLYRNLNLSLLKLN